MSKALKNLPYSKSFKPKASARLHLGDDPEAWNKCGSASENGYADILLLPKQADPFAYHWPVKGIDVLILDPIGVEVSRLERVMLACLSAGALIVMALTPTETFMVQQ